MWHRLDIGQRCQSQLCPFLSLISQFTGRLVQSGLLVLVRCCWLGWVGGVWPPLSQSSVLPSGSRGRKPQRDIWLSASTTQSFNKPLSQSLLWRTGVAGPTDSPVKPGRDGSPPWPGLRTPPTSVCLCGCSRGRHSHVASGFFICGATVAVWSCLNFLKALGMDVRKSGSFVRALKTRLTVSAAYKQKPATDWFVGEAGRITAFMVLSNAALQFDLCGASSTSAQGQNFLFLSLLEMHRVHRPWRC